MQEVPDLAAILHDIPWVLVGGLATRAYMPERMTLDVDILIHARDESQARYAFDHAGYTYVGSLTVGGFSVQCEQNPPIDVLTRRDSWVERALQNPSYDAAGLPVIPLAYLIVMKLEAGRMQDLTDISRMLAGTSDDERAAIRAIVKRECAMYSDDFEQLVLLADLGDG